MLCGLPCAYSFTQIACYSHNAVIIPLINNTPGQKKVLSDLPTVLKFN